MVFLYTKIEGITSSPGGLGRLASRRYTKIEGITIFLFTLGAQRARDSGRGVRERRIDEPGRLGPGRTVGTAPDVVL